jgi:hypothetical protein
MNQFGAWSRTKGVEAGSESALELLGSHGLGAYRPFRYADPRSRTRTERADAAPRPVYPCFTWLLDGEARHHPLLVVSDRLSTLFVHDVAD